MRESTNVDRDATANGHDADPRTAEHHEDARRVAALLWHFDRARRAFEHDATLGVADRRMLWMFSDGEPRTLKQIAEDLRLEQSTVNRQVNAAVAAGLLTRSGDADGRPYRFTIAPHGWEAFAGNVDAAFRVYSRALDALGTNGHRFLDDMGVFIDAYADAVGASTDPSSVTGENTGD